MGVEPRRQAKLVLPVGGRQAQGNETGALTVSEVRALSPDVLLCRFCEEIGGYKPDADEITAFLDAMETVQRGGDLQ